MRGKTPAPLVFLRAAHLTGISSPVSFRVWKSDGHDEDGLESMPEAEFRCKSCCELGREVRKGPGPARTGQNQSKI